MLKPEHDHTIPEETREVAEAAFPKGTVLMRLRDELGPIITDKEFQDLYPSLGQPAESPARLALVSLLQFMENLTDRQAADAVRGRIDWKYMLGLGLSDPGFHYSVLSEFRQRLVSGGREQVLLDRLLERCQSLGLLKGKSKQRTDSTHVVAAVRGLSLLELAGESMRHALNELAQLEPGWLQGIIQPEWVKRYGRRFDSSRLPKSTARREALALEIGADGFALLEAAWQSDAPASVRACQALRTLQRVWLQQYYREDDKIEWRTKKNRGQPPARSMISSPHDQEIRYCVKGTTRWTGYKVHLTETCAAGHPRLITHVATTASTRHDVKMTRTIQAALEARDMKPDVQLVDEGYREIDLLVSSQENGIDLVGPVPSSKSWQDRTPGALDHSQFQIDWENQTATCPAGKTAQRFATRKTWRGTPNWTITFNKQACFACALRSRCSRSRHSGRTLTVYPQKTYEAQAAARRRQETEAFKQLYGERAGIEGTISQGVRRLGLRQTRYIGLPRTQLQHTATAAAINLFRIFDWLVGTRSSGTPMTPFLALAAG
ncbi:MAG: IS1182 family transposase [Nitrospinota bacterium]|nr:IS1182 family transposase [Nitrospinota bacterium]